MKLKLLRAFIVNVTRYLSWYARIDHRASFKDVKLVGVDQRHCFMGYYDVALFDGTSIYYHDVDLASTKEVHPVKADIYRHDITTDKRSYITTTSAVNWQLGSRLNLDENRFLSYIDVSYDGFLVTKELDLKTEKRKVFDFPFWYLKHSFDLGVSIDFSRLARKRPGYGYTGLVKPGFEDSIVFCSLSSDEVLSSISVIDVLGKKAGTTDAYFNHVIVSPNMGFCLTTLNYIDNGVRKVLPLLISIQDFSYKVLDVQGLFSHPSFIGEEELLYFNGNGYVILNFLDNKKLMVWNTTKDGHPTFVNPGEFVSDTYPDRYGDFSLVYFSGKERTLFSMKNPPWYYGDVRCDLHPRVDKGKVFVDIPVLDGRKVGIVNLGSST